MRTELSLGILGLGTVGCGVAGLLQTKREQLEHEIGFGLRLTRVLVRDVDKQRDVAIDRALLTADPAAVVDDPAIDLVIEVMGGEQPAGDYVRRAMTNGKHVVTANKELVAKHGPALLRLAAERNVDFHYEASVGGGIPLIAPFKQDLAANRIQRLRAIINGTTNYILTRMSDGGVEFAEALAEAQQLGYAEPDPTNDVEGIDAGYKLAILASLAFRAIVRPADISIQGISGLSARDFRYARELGYTIKLLAIARESDGQVEVRVHPAMLPSPSMLARVDGVYNAVEVEGDLVGKVMFIGRGAGPMPTASAVIADVIDIATDMQRELGIVTPVIRYDESKRVKPLAAVRSRYYIRLEVADQPGVLAQIATILGDEHISIASIVQQEVNEAAQSAELVIITHGAREAAVTGAIDKLSQLSTVHRVGSVIRIEEDD